MENKLQQLTQKLYDEGLEKGRAEAERLVAEAKTNAAKIVKEAEAQAAKILAEANTKAQDVEKNAMTEISLAGKQALSKIKAEISSMIIAKSTAPAVKAATLDPEFVKQMLLTVAKNWSGADSSKNQLKALPLEAEQKAFEATFEAAAKERWPQASRWVIRRRSGRDSRWVPKTAATTFRFRTRISTLC